MADLLNIGLSGLSVNKTALAVTGHNISNVNTPGFSRQDAVQATNAPQFSGAGYIGSGTTLTDIRRTYNEFLTAEVRNTTALNSDVEAYKSQIDQLDALLAGSTTGITPALQKFFQAVQTAAEDPANIPARQLVLSEGQGLARRFNTVYDRINEQNGFINTQMTAITDQVNRLATSIAGFNDAIAIASANGQQPNDLLDAREEAIRKLSTYIGVKVVPQDDSTLNLFVGSGQPLVVGSNANRIETSIGVADPARFEVDFVSGNSRQTVTSLLSGGELGGLVRYRAETLDTTLNSLGRLALSVTDQVNTQLGQGLDLNGRVGAALYNDINDPALTALRVRAFSTNNTGPGFDVQPTLNITNSSVLTTSDYRLEYDGANYSARRLSDGAAMTVTVTTPLPAAFPETLTFVDPKGRDQGFSVVLDTGAAANDKFLLQPTRRGATGITAVLDQPDQLAFAAPLRAQANLQNRGTGLIAQPAISNTQSPLVPADIQAFSPMTLTYDAASGSLLFPTPLPVGVTVTSTTVSPVPSVPITSVPITSGQGNTLSYTITSGTSTLNITQAFSGSPQDGDTFTLGFNAGGVSDNRNGLNLVNLQSKASVGVDPGFPSSSGVTFSDGYGDLVGRVGSLTAQARQDSDATGTILKQATNNRDSLSAVNLDEEAANLIKFEQYYNASAQIIKVAQSLFDTLINTFR
jgi:flagellar hook-associated protein 1 FlgK